MWADWYLAVTGGVFCCRLGRRKQTSDADAGDDSPHDARSAADAERGPDGWRRAAPLSLQRCTDEGRKVNKQLKCQHLNVSEALAALPFAFQQNRASLQQLNLASRVIFPSHLQAEAPLVPLRRHFTETLPLVLLQTQQFPSMKICIIQSKCTFYLSLWMWSFYVTNDM